MTTGRDGDNHNGPRRTPEEEEANFIRLSALFHKLDLDGDGRIDLDELIAALQRHGHGSGATDLAKVSLTGKLTLILHIYFPYPFLHLCF